MDIRHDKIPSDLAAGRFLATLVERVLDNAPISMHVNVRQLHEHRSLPAEDLADPDLTDET